MPGKGIIVDYGMGNLRSVKKKFDRIETEVEISYSPSALEAADFIVIPGVGHFEAGVRNLKNAGLWEVLNRLALDESKPILGICLGMQLMCTHSEEGGVDGFGWFDARVKRFKVNDTLRYKVPHVGWNYLESNNRLFDEIDLANKPMYFVHSYYVEASNRAQVAAQTKYEKPFDSALENGNIVGFQFHPEKSHSQGEALIRSFLKQKCNV